MVKLNQHRENEMKIDDNRMKYIMARVEKKYPDKAKKIEAKKAKANKSKKYD